MTITPILWTHFVCADGTSAIKIRHAYSEGNKKYQKYYPLNIYVLPGQWNGKRVKTDKHPNAVDINLKIIEIENTIEKECLNDRHVDIEKLINNIINPPAVKLIEVKAVQTVLEYCTSYIERCRAHKILHFKTKQILTEGYIKTFDTCLKRLQWYCDREKVNPTFQDITEDFHDQWMHFLRYEYKVEFKDKKLTRVGLSENSIAKTTISFKVMMEHSAKKDKLHTNLDYESFPATYHDADNIALTEEEINKIVNLDLSAKKDRYLIPEQERFTVAYNFLLRFNDSIRINKKNVFTEAGSHYLKMTTGKTKVPVIIPIMPRVYDILSKNKFVMRSISNQKTNDRIKIIGKMAYVDDDYTVSEVKHGKIKETVYKRYELITTHTTRRSAATNLYHAGVDLKAIQLMGGWKTLQQLEKYLKIDKMENAKKFASHAFFNR